MNAALKIAAKPIEMIIDVIEMIIMFVETFNWLADNQLRIFSAVPKYLRKDMNLWLSQMTQAMFNTLEDHSLIVSLSTVSLKLLFYRKGTSEH